MIYRSREGLGPEDKLLEDQREDWEKNYPFVPICRGVTFFQIEAYKGDELVNQWPASAPPAGVKITISFAEPYETVRGTRDVFDDQKISRTIAIDPMRKIKFALDASGDPNSPAEPNQQDAKEPTDESEGGRQTPAPAPNTRTPTTRSRGSVSNERTPTQTRRR